jgi:hypothetical protein
VSTNTFVCDADIAGAIVRGRRRGSLLAQVARTTLTAVGVEFAKFAVVKLGTLLA